MEVKIEASWKQLLAGEFEKPYFEGLTRFIRDEYAQHKIYPPGKLIFNAFNQCPVDLVKVVILGQDPYHGPGQAHGLCFSVLPGVPVPPSLIGAESLVVKGDWTFDGPVEVRGAVTLADLGEPATVGGGR